LNEIERKALPLKNLGRGRAARLDVSAYAATFYRKKNIFGFFA